MSCTDPMPFFNPVVIASFSLGVEQVNKVIPFKSTLGVFSPSATVSFYTERRGNSSRRLIAVASIGDGLTLTGDNSSGVEKTLTLSIDGATFSDYANQRPVYAECSLFSTGDIDLLFGIEVK